MASEIENHFTVFIRLPFNRGTFVDPPPVAWSAAKERDLWELISKQSKGNEVDWKQLADQFEVSQQFLLQQAAWLYERQLSQVRAQMRRMGARQSATSSPVPPSTTASAVATQVPRRGNSLSSRAPSRLSTQNVSTPVTSDINSPTTPGRSRFGVSTKSGTGPLSSNLRGGSASRPLSRRSSKDYEPSSRTHSRRGSLQQVTSKPPAEMEPPEESSSGDEIVSSRIIHNRPNPAGIQRRPPSLRKSQHARQKSITHVEEETEEEDSPAFLPYSEPLKTQESIPSNQDISATIRGATQHTTHNRPSTFRRSTSERIRIKSVSSTNQQHAEQRPPLTSSASSNDGFQPQSRPATTTTTATQHSVSRRNQGPISSDLPTPLSPRQQAALAHAAGLAPRSPRRRPNHIHTGSESSPSMGSSFSDLDDASVTQSALEEALMSGMGSVATTAGGGTGPLAGVGGLGSRVSGISQALRSRYFDARSSTGTGTRINRNENEK